MEPLISIITPCYNQGQYLDDAIESIAAIETSYTYEHIIINDGSTDALTVEKFKELESKGHHIIHQQNTGLATARNNAIAIARGKYILPLDADNRLHKNYLTEAIEVLEKNENISVVYGNSIMFGEKSFINIVPPFDLTRILKFNYIDACAVFRKRIWENAGGYDSKMPVMGNEDWELWVNCFFKGAEIFHLNKECFYYRWNSASMVFTVTIPGFKQNREYLLKKYAEEIVEYYALKDAELNSIKSILDRAMQNKIRTAAKLILKGNL